MPRPRWPRFPGFLRLSKKPLECSHHLKVRIGVTELSTGVSIVYGKDLRRLGCRLPLHPWGKSEQVPTLARAAAVTASWAV